MEIVNLTKQQIQNTELYKRLDNLQQQLILKKDVFEQIRLGVNLVKNKGIELYKKEHNPNDRVLLFVKELTHC